MGFDEYLTTPNLIIAVLALGAVGYVLGRMRAVSASGGKAGVLHSRPGYHAAFVMIWTTVPSLLILAAWLVLQPLYVESRALESFPPSVLEDETGASLRMNTVMQIAEGFERLDEERRQALTYGVRDARTALNEVGVPTSASVQIAPFMPRAAKVVFETRRDARRLMSIVIAAVAVLGLVVALARVSTKLRARNSVERSVRVVLIAASTIAILTTFGIVLALIFDTITFFGDVPVADFLFGTTWDPGFGGGASGSRAGGGEFGFLPLLWGTVYVSILALIVAVPIGLFAAIYMAEFASERVRAFAKPVLEVLAGVPTIVYGFFALVTVGPFIRDMVMELSGASISSANAVTAGLVMGIMIIPFVSSLSDDIITAVPQSLRDASLGLGATQAETIKKVVLPAALPGIVAAVLLAASRAIGETMIVVLAAGATANLTLDAFESMTTITVTIVNLLKADVDFTSTPALSAYALGIALFVITLAMNIYALRIVRKYREQYE